jgi:LytS/YehU family sensor histidine kinase
MGNESFIALISNVSLLLAMVFVYDLAINRPLKLDTRLRLVMIGVGLGIITATVMLTPWVFEPGIVFDTRSVLISISGLFFGAVPTVIVMVMASTLRLSQGGAAFTGACVITASGLIGVVWRRSFKRPLTSLNWRDLLGLGYTVHIAMLALMFTLPWQTALRVVSHIALPRQSKRVRCSSALSRSRPPPASTWSCWI